MSLALYHSTTISENLTSRRVTLSLFPDLYSRNVGLGCTYFRKSYLCIRAERAGVSFKGHAVDEDEADPLEGDEPHRLRVVYLLEPGV